MSKGLYCLPIGQRNVLIMAKKATNNTTTKKGKGLSPREQWTKNCGGKTHVDYFNGKCSGTLNGFGQIFVRSYILTKLEENENAVITSGELNKAYFSAIMEEVKTRNDKDTRKNKKGELVHKAGTEWYRTFINADGTREKAKCIIAKNEIFGALRCMYFENYLFNVRRLGESLSLSKCEYVKGLSEKK